jgi:hypothetical protein
MPTSSTTQKVEKGGSKFEASPGKVSKMLFQKQACLWFPVMRKVEVGGSQLDSSSGKVNMKPCLKGKY